MAPGWMISRQNYLDMVRPNWLDAAGNMLFGSRFVPNGHWYAVLHLPPRQSSSGSFSCIEPRTQSNRTVSINLCRDRFFDSQIRSKECIYPEIPRIAHQGGGGFTVSKKGQMELYSNIRLSRLADTASYGKSIFLKNECDNVHR